MVDICLLGTTSADALVLTVRPIVLNMCNTQSIRLEWAHYRHPLPEYVYDVYMKYWSDVYFIQQNLYRFFKNAALLFQQLFWSPELLEASLSRRYLLFKVVEENYK